MSSAKRLDRAFEQAQKLEFDDSSRFIIFSDCHRGDSSFADEFANNRNIYFHALSDYCKRGFTYIELGDGDELWETLSFETIFNAHRNIYFLLKKFFDAKRYYTLFGNHDLVYRNEETVKKNYDTYFDQVSGEEIPFMPGLKYMEGLILKHRVSGQEIFLTHGHQADWWNSVAWKWGRFMVRILWKPLQIFGIQDPTSPAQNYKELIKVERRIKQWIISKQHQFTITGHTHRPRFPQPGEIPYFNDGSCVHPRSITGLEIENGAISLVKWFTDTTDDGYLKINKAILEGPRKLTDYIRD